MIAYPCCTEEGTQYPCCPYTTRVNPEDTYCTGPGGFYIPGYITIESQVSCDCGEGGSLEPCNGYFGMSCNGQDTPYYTSYQWIYFDPDMAECLCPYGLGFFKLHYTIFTPGGAVYVMAGLWGFFPAPNPFLTCQKIFDSVEAMGTDFFLNLSDYLFDTNCYRYYPDDCDCPTFHLTTGMVP